MPALPQRPEPRVSAGVRSPDPRSVHAATELHQERLCACFTRETGVPLTILRYHNVYGPRMPGRHSLLRCGGDVPQRTGGREGAERVRGRGPAAALPT